MGLLQPTVLIVDDEEDIRQILADRLEATGLRVLTAVDGEDGLEKIVAEKPDVVFLDLNMPKKDGMAVLRELRERNVKQDVVVVTAYATIDRAVEAMKLGACDFLMKPFDGEHLKLVCEKVLEGQRLRRDAALWQERAKKYLHQMYPANVADDLVAGTLVPRHIECSVLFTDLVGFTDFAARHSPRESAAVLTHYFSRMHQVVLDTGGWVDNFFGDGMMVVYGIPSGSPTHARDAVHAAIAMQRALEAGGGTLHQRLSVNSGTVLVGDVGSRQKPHYSVIGEAVNVGARLVDIARPKELLIGEVTMRCVGREFPTESIGPIDIKGVGNIPVYRVLYEHVIP